VGQDGTVLPCFSSAGLGPLSALAQDGAVRLFCIRTYAALVVPLLRRTDCEAGGRFVPTNRIESPRPQVDIEELRKKNRRSIESRAAEMAAEMSKGMAEER
jgi:hypothetical protein